MVQLDELLVVRAIEVVGEYYSVQLISRFTWMQSLSEFVGKLDGGFPQPLVVKCSDKADNPLRSPNGKLDNSIKKEQYSKLTRSRWWVNSLHPGSPMYWWGVAYLWKEISQRRKILISILKHTQKEELMRWTSIKFDGLILVFWNSERIYTSVTPDLLRGPQQTSRWNLMIRFKGYSCGWWSRYVILIADSLIVGSRDQTQHPGYTDQENGGRSKRAVVCSESFWFGEQCYGGCLLSSQTSKVIGDDQYSRMLSDLKQLNLIAQTVSACVLAFFSAQIIILIDLLVFQGSIT